MQKKSVTGRFVGMGLDPSAHPAARSALNRAEWRAVFTLRRAFGRAARNGHCARRRVSERNRRTAAALSAEIDRSLQNNRKVRNHPVRVIDSLNSPHKREGSFCTLYLPKIAPMLLNTPAMLSACFCRASTFSIKPGSPASTLFSESTSNFCS